MINGLLKRGGGMKGRLAKGGGTVRIGMAV